MNTHPDCRICAALTTPVDVAARRLAATQTRARRARHTDNATTALHAAIQRRAAHRGEHHRNAS